MPIRELDEITGCRNFFLEPATPRQRMYEALRAYYVEGLSSQDAARRFGYSPASFRVLCHEFKRGDTRRFFVENRPGPRDQPKKASARETIVGLRKRNYSVYDISEALKESGVDHLSPTAINEVLKEEGFAPLPRRRETERPGRPRPTAEPVADVGEFSLEPRSFGTACGGLFLFVPWLVELQLDKLARTAGLPGSSMVPAEHALRACLALKLWSLERKSHVMALVADEGLALFAGLNAIPKRSYLAEYSSQVAPDQIPQLLADWHGCVAEPGLFDGGSFNLDFHSVPFYGEDPLVERHYVSMRSRSQPSVLVCLAQDAEGRAFCYSNANLRKGEEGDEILRFVAFWEKVHGERPKHLVFDSKFTTYANLAILDELGIGFITLRRRTKRLIAEIEDLPASAWRRLDLEVSTRKFRHPRVFEEHVVVANRDLRQVFVKDLGHEEPTILLTNEPLAPKPLITRYAQRMLIENALSDAVRFFHMDALSSAVGLKVDFDMALTVIASGLYRLFAHDVRGYADAQARTVFRDLISMPADVTISDAEIVVRFPRRAHTPILRTAHLLDRPVRVPWWDGKPLTLTS